MTELEERLQLAVAITREVGDLTMRYFRTTDLIVGRKTDNSPVTRADKEGELLMRERLAAACPDDAIHVHIQAVGVLSTWMRALQRISQSLRAPFIGDYLACAIRLQRKGLSQPL